MPDGHYNVPLGKAKVVREGEALTVLTYGTMVHVALAAVEENGVDAEVILGCYAVGREPPVLPEDAVRTLRKMGDLVA